MKFLVFALSSYIFQGILIYTMYQSFQHSQRKLRKGGVFQRTLRSRRSCGMFKVTQEAEDNCFIICLGSSNTLSALPGSVPHPPCGLTFNIVSPGCGWLPVGPVHCHSETVSCAVCMPPSPRCLPHSFHEIHLLCEQPWTISTFLSHPQPQ